MKFTVIDKLEAAEAECGRLRAELEQTRITVSEAEGWCARYEAELELCRRERDEACDDYNELAAGKALDLCKKEFAEARTTIERLEGAARQAEKFLAAYANATEETGHPDSIGPVLARELAGVLRRALARPERIADAKGEPK